MIVYAFKQIRGVGLLLKRKYRKRVSDKNVRRYDRIERKYRKLWWHFRTRWDSKGETNETRV